MGFEAKVGFIQCPERIVFIELGTLFHYSLFSLTLFYVVDFPVTLLEIAICSVAVLVNFTAIQRIVHIYKQKSI